MMKVIDLRRDFGGASRKDSLGGCCAGIRDGVRNRKESDRGVAQVAGKRREDVVGKDREVLFVAGGMSNSVSKRNLPMLMGSV